MGKLFKNRSLLVVIIIIAIVFLMLKIKNDKGINLNIPGIQKSTDTTFLHVTKQFGLSIPKDWSVTEPVSGQQTFVFPTGTEISSGDIQTVIDQDIIIIQTAINKKADFNTLVSDIKTAAEEKGSTVTEKPLKYGNLRGNKLTFKGEINYEQLYFDAPQVIIMTAKADHPILDKLGKSVITDLTPYADDIAQVTNLTRQTRDDIRSGNYTNIYASASENIKSQKTESDFASMFEVASSDFNFDALIWGVFINANGLGSAINIADGSTIIRRGSFYYVKNEDTYLLDGLKVSGKITTTTTE